MVPLKYLSSFWRTLEMPLINCETNLILTRSASCAISNAGANQATIFAITDTNFMFQLLLYQLKIMQLKTIATTKIRFQTHN